VDKPTTRLANKNRSDAALKKISERDEFLVKPEIPVPRVPIATERPMRFDRRTARNTSWAVISISVHVEKKAKIPISDGLASERVREEIPFAFDIVMKDHLGLFIHPIGVHRRRTHDRGAVVALECEFVIHASDGQQETIWRYAPNPKLAL
jgi:hypothetical protein